MTAITLAQFITRARQLGDYAEDDGVFTDAVMTPWVNEALGDYCAILDKHHAGYRDKSGTVSTIANTATVALPADFLKLRAIDLSYGGKWGDLDRWTPETARSFTSTGTPVAYLRVGANLELFPTPDAVYSIRLRYVPTPTVLTSGSDSIDVPAGWEGFIVQSILLNCDIREERPLGDRKDSIAIKRAIITDASAGNDTSKPTYLPFPWERKRAFP
jgi:hypothetical protein